MPSPLVTFRPIRASLLALAAAFASAPLSAAVVQLLAVGAKSSAQVRVDGVTRELRLERFTDEGLLLQKVDGDHAVFLFNGASHRLRVGDTVIVDGQPRGLPSHQVRLNAQGRYSSSVRVNNGASVDALIDRNSAGIVIPVADADRLRLAYKDAPARTHQTPRPKASKGKGKAKAEPSPPPDAPKQPDTYKTYRITLASVRIGPIDLYGLPATVSEQPGLEHTVLGRDFLKRAAPSWANGVLTLVRP